MDNKQLSSAVMNHEKVTAALANEREKSCKTIRENHAKFNELNDNQSKELDEALKEAYTMGFSGGFEGGLDVGFIAIEAQNDTTNKQLVVRSFLASLVSTVLSASVFTLTKNPLAVMLITAFLVAGSLWAADTFSRFLYKKIVLKK